MVERYMLSSLTTRCSGSRSRRAPPSNGIVWAIDATQFSIPGTHGLGAAVLHAYDANNLATEFWNSSQAPNNRNQAGNAVKVSVPTIANGRVYMGTQSTVEVYGLLPN
jgi:hypothetical protein